MICCFKNKEIIATKTIPFICYYLLDYGSTYRNYNDPILDKKKPQI